MAVYCIVPRELAGKLEKGLREHQRDHPDVHVIVERRGIERRRDDRRGCAHSGSSRRPRERRGVRAAEGRRIAERRAPALALDCPPLPRRLARYADRLMFVERVEPSEKFTDEVRANRLVARFQGGDQQAFADLYNMYFDRLYGYMKAGLRNRDDAEDRVQQVFAQVVAALPRFQISPHAPFSAWLFRIARNELLKTIDRERKTFTADPHWLDSKRDEADEEILDSTLRWLSDGELLMFVERLPAMQRQALILRYMMGFDTAEIARVLESSPDNVRQLEHRALRFLEKRLTAIGRAPVRNHRAATLVLLRQAPVLRMRRFALI